MITTQTEPLDASLDFTPERKTLFAQFFPTIPPANAQFVHLEGKKTVYFTLTNENIIFYLAPDADITLNIHYKNRAIAPAQVRCFFIVNRNAHCSCYESLQTHDEIHFTAALQKDSTFTRMGLVHHSPVLHRDYFLKEAGAQVTDHAIYLTQEKEEQHHWVTVTHEAPTTKSTFHAKALVSRAAYTQIYGTVIIQPTAIQSSTFFGAHALLLEKDAYARIIPALEIHTSNVQNAGHATTVRPLDTDHLFYLTSRGIAEEDARKELTLGFINDLLIQFPEHEQTAITQLINDQ